MKRIFISALSLLLILSFCACRNTPSDEIHSELCAFIVDIKNNTMLLDVAEYITTDDADRISQLELTVSDLPDGYYIYNENTLTEQYAFTDETVYNIIDWHNTFTDEGDDRNYTTTDIHEFIDYLHTYEDSRPGMPFFFEIADGKIITVTEKPMM